MDIEEYLHQVIDIREYKRGQAVKLSEAGLSRGEIAKALSVSESFVSKWRARYGQDGTAGLGLSYQGSKGFLSESQKEKVLDWLSTQSGSVSVERLEGYVNEQYGVQYRSKQSYYDLLSLAGMSYKKRQAVNPKKDEQKVLERREEIKKSTGPSPADQPAGDRGPKMRFYLRSVVLEDECHLLWGDVCGYGWGKTTERLVVPVGNAKDRQSYFGALNGKTGELLLQAAPKADSAATVAFLKQLREHYPGKQVWVIWDNASYHCSQLVKDYLQQVNGQLPQEQWPLTLIGLATNAPEQNPIEQVWLDGKTKLRKQTGLNTFAQVKKCFVDSIADNTYKYEKFKWYFP